MCTLTKWNWRNDKKSGKIKFISCNGINLFINIPISVEHSLLQYFQKLEPENPPNLLSKIVGNEHENSKFYF